jgi:hypothetical protein
MMDCGFGQACNDDHTCADDMCGWKECDCSGDGCSDPLCTD